VSTYMFDMHILVDPICELIWDSAPLGVITINNK